MVGLAHPQKPGFAPPPPPPTNLISEYAPEWFALNEQSVQMEVKHMETTLLEYMNKDSVPVTQNAK